MNGKAVLPMAVASELMCQAAVSNNPGLEFVGYNEMKLLKGVVLNNESELLKVFASQAELQPDGTYISHAEIRTDGVKWEHTNAKADIILAPKGLTRKSPDAVVVDSNKTYSRSVEEAYKECLFHGEFLQAITEFMGWSEKGMVAISDTSKPVEEWFLNSRFTNWQSDPLMIDAAYQLMILWTTEVLGAPSLPNYANSYRQYVKSLDCQPVIISAKAAPKGSSAATADIQFRNQDGKVLAEIKGYECAVSAKLTEAFKNRIIGA